ncbi:hypothetical protein [Novosphingobium sp. MBES04]|uniref:hypothetical protein n=1 Tax=Novosphingobium sp. MBES04 TaxID=1206458 RepID=UPI0011850C43|nr:hypothetical protein [Novosphingobium sp. MBES04]
MSDTKWRKLFAAIHVARPEIHEMVVKFIDVDTPRLMQFPPSLSCPHPYMDTIEFGPTELRAIEWAEFSTDVSDILAPLGRFPLSIQNGRSRLTGYADAFPLKVG